MSCPRPSAELAEAYTDGVASGNGVVSTMPAPPLEQPAGMLSVYGNEPLALGAPAHAVDVTVGDGVDCGTAGEAKIVYGNEPLIAMPPDAVGEGVDCAPPQPAGISIVAPLTPGAAAQAVEVTSGDGTGDFGNRRESTVRQPRGLAHRRTL